MALMAIRTTNAQVAAIIELEVTVSTEPFIEVANSLVTELCTDSDYTDEKLELIERWLSAHFYAIREGRATLEKAGKVSATIQSKVDLGFDVTHYGQMAMRIDTAGNLAKLNEQTKKGGVPVVGMTWVGRTEEEAIAAATE